MEEHHYASHPFLNVSSSFSFVCPKEKKQPACAGRKKKAPRSKTHFRAKRPNLSLLKNVLTNLSTLSSVQKRHF